MTHFPNNKPTNCCLFLLIIDAITSNNPDLQSEPTLSVQSRNYTFVPINVCSRSMYQNRFTKFMLFLANLGLRCYTVDSVM